MCFHWQDRAIEKYKIDIMYKNIPVEIARIKDQYIDAMNAWEAFRTEHNISENQPIGFYAGQLFYYRLQLEALNEAWSKISLPT